MMADLGTTTATTAEPGTAGSADDVGRRVTRRRTLPGGRAVVGALLISLAVIGVFAAWLTATAAPTTSYAVLRSDLAPGQEVAMGDLRLIPMDLPEAQAARAFTSIDEATASVALAPLATGDLLTRSAVRPADEVPGTSRFSFPVAASRAVAGELSPGDRVDVLVTDDGTTGYVATDIPVIDVDGDGGEVVVTLAIDDPAVVLALAHASDEGTLHVATTNPQRDADVGVRRDSFGSDAVEPGPSTGAPGDPGQAPTDDAQAPGDGEPTSGASGSAGGDG